MLFSGSAFKCLFLFIFQSHSFLSIHICFAIFRRYARYESFHLHIGIYLNCKLFCIRSQEFCNSRYADVDAYYISLKKDFGKDDVISMLKKEGFWNVPNLRIKFLDPVEAHFPHTSDDMDQEEAEWDAAADRRGRVALPPCSVLSATGNNAGTALMGECTGDFATGSMCIGSLYSCLVSVGIQSVCVSKRINLTI